MVSAVLDDTDLRRRAWEAASQVVDPEIPVLTIADLGVLRDVQIHDGRVEVAITPTYTGCPAMNMIALEIELAHRAVAGLDHRLDERGRPQQAQGVRHRAATGLEFPPRAVRRTACRVPAMRFAQYRAAVRIRFDLLQGAVALQELPRTVRLFQVSLRS